MTDSKWQQVVPATGWLAVFVDPEKRELYSDRVAFWVWTRSVDVDGSTYDDAEGVLARTSLMEVKYQDESDYFVGYAHESDGMAIYAGEIDRVIERAAQKYKREQERYARKQAQ